MAFLSLRNVSKGFESARGRREVLSGVNLDVAEGEFIAIVGASGSGKTTLVSLIAGLLLPDEGKIELAGKEIVEPGPERGIVFQNYSLLAWMTVYENVYLAVDAVSPTKSAAEKKQRTEQLLRMVNLGHAMQKTPRELSGGMRQRVAVARGFAMDPRVLLLDEPFSALDALTRSSLQEELARIWVQDRKTMILITNDIEEAILLADRIFPLTNGPGATLGTEIRVDIPRPRVRRHLSLDANYQHTRRAVIDVLSGQHVATRQPQAEAVAA